MKLAFSSDLAERVAQNGIIAVVVIDKAEHAAPLADALAQGGIGAVELTLRTPEALDAMKRMRAHAPDMIVGAGTVLFPEQVRQVCDAGAHFAVAPGMNRRVMQAAADAGLSFAPGIATPSDIEAALEYNCRVMKFFPAEVSGGISYLRNMAAPYKHLGIRYIPLGGLNADNMLPYVKDELISAIGGSWIAPREKIAAQDWAGIAASAKQAMELISKNRK